MKMLGKASIDKQMEWNEWHLVTLIRHNGKVQLIIFQSRSYFLFIFYYLSVQGSLALAILN